MWGNGLQVSCYSSWLTTQGYCVSAKRERKREIEEEGWMEGRKEKGLTEIER